MQEARGCVCVTKLLCQRRMVRRQAKRKLQTGRAPEFWPDNQCDDLVTRTPAHA